MNNTNTTVQQIKGYLCENSQLCPSESDTVIVILCFIILAFITCIGIRAMKQRPKKETKVTPAFV